MSTHVCSYCSTSIADIHPRFCSEACRLAQNAYAKKYREANIESAKEWDKKSYSRTKEKHKARRKAYLKKYYKENSATIKRRSMQAYANDKAGTIKRNSAYIARRIQVDPLYALTRRLRLTIGDSLRKRGYAKRSRTYELLGADYATVYSHLLGTWAKNYGTAYNGEPVHIDHIVPCASASTEDELIALQHYTNLQWLTPSDNLKKGAR